MEDEALEIVREGGRILAPFLAQGMRLEGRLASAVESYRELCATLGESFESQLDGARGRNLA